MAGKTILITGSSGYVGRHLYPHLRMKGYNVLGLQHEHSIAGQITVPGDVMATSSLDRVMAGVGMVVHCAARVGSGWPKNEYLINSEGTKHVLNAAIEAGVERFIHMSSLAVADEYRDHYNDDEAVPTANRFHDRYTPSKIQAEKYVLEKKDKIHALILRPGWIWGPGEKGIRQLFARIKEGRFALIGTGNNRTYLTYIDNILQAITLALEATNIDSGEIFNITDGMSQSFVEIVNIITSELGVPLVTRRIPRGLANTAAFFFEFLKPSANITRQNVSIMARNLQFSIDKATRILGYKPDTDLRKHVKAVIEGGV